MSVQLQWKHQFQFAGIYAALQEGYYEQAGLALTVLEGGPGIDAVQRVTDGTAEFGTFGQALVLRYLDGADIRMLAPVVQHDPSVLLVRGRVSHPGQLVGLGPIAFLPGAQGLAIKAMLLREGIALERLQVVPPRQDAIEQLISGELAAIPGYLSNEAFTLRERQVPHSVLRPADYGIDFYGDALFTRAALADAQPELVRAFRDATLRGWRYALDHPDEIVALIEQRYNSQKLSAAHLRHEASVLAELIDAGLIDLGHSNPGRWERIAATYRQVGLTTSDRTLEGFTIEDEPAPRVSAKAWGWALAATAAVLVLAIIAARLRAANRRLEQERAQSGFMFDGTTDALCTWDEQFRVTRWNAAAERLFGWTQAEALGRDVLDLQTAAELRPAVRATLKAMLESGTPVSGLNEGLSRDGSRPMIDWLNVPLPVRDGQARQVLTRARDVSAQVKTERDLAEALAAVRSRESELRQTLNAIDVAVARIDEAGRVAAANRAVAQIMGVSVADMLRRRLGDAVDPDDRAAFERLLADARENPASVLRAQLRLGAEGEAARWYATSARLYLSVDAQPMGVMLVMADIDALKRREAELEQARLAAEAGLRAKDVFLRSMGHEFRTPLNAIMGYAQVLQYKADGAPAQRQMAQEIIDASRQLLQLLGDVMDLSRLAATAGSATLQAVELDRVLAEACAAADALADARGVTLRALAPSQAWVMADPDRLSQVMRHLLINAIRYNRPQGQVEVVVRPAADERWRIDVADTGPGIAEADRAHLFEPFNRLGREGTDAEGAGVGLSLVRALTEGMDGRVGVDSELGAGSCFWIELRSATPGDTGHADRAGAPASSSVSTPAGPGASAGAVPLVLCIDDNPVNLRLLQHVLAPMDGLRVSLASSADEALALAQADPPALVLMDIAMPQMDGYAALQALQRLPGLERVPVIAVTGRALPDEVERGQRAGFVDYLTKPLDVNRLRQTVRQWLAARP